MSRSPPLARVLPFEVVDDAWRLALVPAIAAAVVGPFLPRPGSVWPRSRSASSGSTATPSGRRPIRIGRSSRPPTAP